MDALSMSPLLVDEPGDVVHHPVLPVAAGPILLEGHFGLLLLLVLVMVVVLVVVVVVVADHPVAAG